MEGIYFIYYEKLGGDDRDKESSGEDIGSPELLYLRVENRDGNKIEMGHFVRGRNNSTNAREGY